MYQQLKQKNLQFQQKPKQQKHKIKINLFHQKKALVKNRHKLKKNQQQNLRKINQIYLRQLLVPQNKPIKIIQNPLKNRKTTIPLKMKKIIKNLKKKKKKSFKTGKKI